MAVELGHKTKNEDDKTDTFDPHSGTRTTHQGNGLLFLGQPKKNKYGKLSTVDYKSGLDPSARYESRTAKEGVEEMNESYKVGDLVKPLTGPHKGVDHRIIHVYSDGIMNITPHRLRARDIKYKNGAALARPEQVEPSVKPVVEPKTADEKSRNSAALHYSHLLRKESLDETSPTKHGVFVKGGSIGSDNTKPIKTFDSKEEAHEFAKRRRKALTPGERGYYGMGYVVKPIKENLDEANKIVPVSKIGKGVEKWADDYYKEPDVIPAEQEPKKQFKTDALAKALKLVAKPTPSDKQMKQAQHFPKKGVRVVRHFMKDDIELPILKSGSFYIIEFRDAEGELVTSVKAITEQGVIAAANRVIDNALQESVSYERVLEVSKKILRK